MKILLTGGTGLIGSALRPVLLEAGHELCVLTRRPERFPEGAGVRALASLDELRGMGRFDAVVNLSGAPILGGRWTRRRRQVIRDSRIGVTRDLVALFSRTGFPGVLISGSAIGYYGNTGAARVVEGVPPGDDFGARLCADWEQAAGAVEGQGTRLCVVRTGLVLSDRGGALGRMLTSFRLGLGGRIGDGGQWMSWIHIRDQVDAMVKLLHDEDCSGVYNLTAPNPVTNADFAARLGRALRRPALLPAPTWLLRGLLGEASELLLGGQKVLPERLREQGFEFTFPDLEAALADLVA